MVVVVPSLRGLLGRTGSVDVGRVDKVLLVVVRGGIELLKLGPMGVELRVVVVPVVVIGRPLELEGMTELEDGMIEELLNRMLELGVGMAELENGRDEEVDDVLVVVGPGHSVTVLVTVSNGQLVTVTVARGQLLVVIVAVGVAVTTMGGQAAQRAVAIEQMAVGRVEVGQVLAVTVVVRGPRVDVWLSLSQGLSSWLEPSSSNSRAISMAPVRSGLTPCPSPAFASRSAMTISSPRTG